MDKLAHFLSWALLPLFMPIFGLLVILYAPSEFDVLTVESNPYFMNPEAKKFYLYIFGIFATVAPGLSFLILYRTKMIRTLDMEDRKDRNSPLLLTVIYALTLVLLFWNASKTNYISRPMYALAVAGAAVSICSLLLTYRWKISLHGAGAGIFAATVLFQAYYFHFLSIWPIILSILIPALVLFARLFLGKHNQFEAYFGLILGSLCTFVAHILLV